MSPKERVLAMQEITSAFEERRGRKPRTVRELSEFLGTEAAAAEAARPATPGGGRGYLKSLEWIGR